MGALLSVSSQLLTPAQALQRHCSEVASNELWLLPTAGYRQMRVSALCSAQAWEGARGCFKVLGWRSGEGRLELSKNRPGSTLQGVSLSPPKVSGRMGTRHRVFLSLWLVAFIPTLSVSPAQSYISGTVAKSGDGYDVGMPLTHHGLFNLVINGHHTGSRGTKRQKAKRPVTHPVPL